MKFYAHVIQRTGKKHSDDYITLDEMNANQDKGVQAFTVKHEEKISKYFERAPIFTNEFAELLGKLDLAKLSVKIKKREKIHQIKEDSIIFK